MPIIGMVTRPYFDRGLRSTQKWLLLFNWGHLLLLLEMLSSVSLKEVSECGRLVRLILLWDELSKYP